PPLPRLIDRGLSRAQFLSVSSRLQTEAQRHLAWARLILPVGPTGRRSTTAHALGTLKCARRSSRSVRHFWRMEGGVLLPATTTAQTSSPHSSHGRPKTQA